MKPPVALPSSPPWDREFFKAACALSFLTRQPIEFENLSADERTFLDALNTGAGGSPPGPSTGRVLFEPGDFKHTRPFPNPSPWTAGDLLETLLPAMIARRAPETLAVHGITHGTQTTSISLLAEGLLPMLDRRGTRSWIEINQWGIGTPGRVKLEVRPPLGEFLSERLTERGPIVELRIFAAGPKTQVSLLTEAVAQVGALLDEADILYPEDEVQAVADIGDQGLLMVRAEYGNMRVIVETLCKGEVSRPWAASIAEDLLRYHTSTVTVPRELAYPLILSAILSPQESCFHTSLHTEEIDRFQALIARFIPEVTLRNESSLLRVQGVDLQEG